MAEASRTLENTPTWTVAALCAMFIIVSLVVERTLHLTGHWLSKTNRKPLLQALERLKEELMLLGFISLVIAVSASSISGICVKASLYNTQFMPCNSNDEKKLSAKHFLVARMLSETSTGSCGEGKEPLISLHSLEQLHRFIFILGAVHVFYTCLAVILGLLKVFEWKKWENEAFLEAQQMNDVAELRKNLTKRRQSSFVARHASTPGSQYKIIGWVICFFRQFGKSVGKSDYLALRLGFLSKHRLSAKYDFHRYMVRSIEDESKYIVGISPFFWLLVVLFLLINVDGINLYFILAFVPVVLVLIVGAKLQRIISHLALENLGLTDRLTGAHIQPRDSLFWFRSPKLMLHCIHFVLFQNAFELAMFFWVWWEFGLNSCYLGNRIKVYIRIAVGFLAQVLCSYSTLPLYALVTQMGSEYKKAIFKDNVIETLDNWKKVAKQRVKQGHAAMPPAGVETIEEQVELEEIQVDNTSYSATASPSELPLRFHGDIRPV